MASMFQGKSVCIANKHTALLFTGHVIFSHTTELWQIYHSRFIVEDGRMEFFPKKYPVELLPTNELSCIACLYRSITSLTIFLMKIAILNCMIHW